MSRQIAPDNLHLYEKLPQALENPSLPCITETPKLQFGQKIYIVGKINDDANSFIINLAHGPSKDTDVDISLHISARFKESDDGLQIVRNSCLGGDWGDEERDVEDDLTLSPGSEFECHIIVHHDCYKIYFNEAYVGKFNYRRSKSEVSHVAVNGDITLETVGFENPTPHGLNAPSRPAVFQTAPLHVGQKVVVLGAINDGCNRFTINLQDSESNISLHINPRFDEGGDPQLVRNSYLGGWGSEERDLPGEIPDLKPGGTINCEIYILEHAYRIIFNGVDIGDYKYRNDVSTVTQVSILDQGDITLEVVNVENPTSYRKSSRKF